MAKIFIRAGHGGKDPGVCALGRRESDDTLRYAKGIGHYLVNTGHSVMLSRTDDTYMTISAIATNANNWGADVCIDCHRNAGGGLGIECLYNSKSSARGIQLAKDIQAALVAVGGMKDRGAKKQDKNTGFISATKAPCTIIELGFVDSAEDNATFEARHDAYCQAVANAIHAFMGGGAQPAPAPAPVPAQPDTWSISRLLRHQKPLRQGEDVRDVQKVLVANGIGIGKVDGIFGPKTHAGVREFQKRHGLVTDGIVGPKTVAAMGGRWVAKA